MITFIKKYKTLLLSSLLTAYLVGTFQDSCLEGLHVASHLMQVLFTNPQVTVVHEHEHGQEHTHRHLVLETMEKSLDNFSDDAIPTDEKSNSTDSKKKKTERQATIDSLYLVCTPLQLRPVSKSYAISSNYPSVLTPPPKC